MLRTLGLALLLQAAAFCAYAQPGAPQEAGANLAPNGRAASIFQDHILLRPGETILVRLAGDDFRIVPRFVAQGEEARPGDPSHNQVRFTFMPDGSPVLRVENNWGARLSFRAAYKDNVGNTTTPESCPAYRGITDLRVPPRAIRVEIDQFRWGGHERSGQEC